MARTPSMSTTECEALLGPRGALRVDANNRATVRKWLTAQGFPSLFVGALSMTELALAYNQTDGKGLDAIRRKLEAIPADEREESTATDPAPVATQSAPQAASDIESAIRAIAASVTPKHIDESMVRAIVRDEAPKLLPQSPLVHIQVTQGDTTRDLGDMPMHAQFPTLVKALAAGLHVFLCGPAGSGKTTAAELAAKALGREFRIEGAVSGEHKLTGFVDGHGKYHGTPYRDAFEAGHIFVKDEIDGDDPAGLLALNAGMANGYAAFPDVTKPVMRGDGFQVVACANTWGMGADRLYVGRNQLDAATLDRFVFIAWDYDSKLEAALCPNPDWLARVQALRAAAFAEKARIVISPRASIYGAKLLAAGLDMTTVETMTIWKGVDAELRRRIEGRAR